jgi:capsular exopolysaccharide synthesis family protein
VSKIYEALRKAQTENEGEVTAKRSQTALLSQNVGDAEAEEGPPARAETAPPKKEAPTQTAKVMVPEEAGYGAVDRKLVTLLEPESLPAEQFRKIRAVLSQLRAAKGWRSIMITSSLPEEGKSLVACNLGVAITQGLDEKAILIDCDLRRPKVHSFFGVIERPGLGELLEGKSELSESIREIPGLRLKIVPAGRSQIKPAELLSSEKMAGFLRKLKEKYDDHYIILDTTPVLLTAETGVLARRVDGVLLLIRWGKTSRDVVKKAVKEISRDKLIGVIFNDTESGDGYSSEYHQGYYRTS